MAAGILGAMLIALLTAGSAFAAHPLVTEDTGTQGAGKFQVESLSEFQRTQGSGVTGRRHAFDLILTGGLADTLDIALDIPVLHVGTESGGNKKSVSGFSDLNIEAKWRFFQAGSFSMALEPSISIPSGDEAKELGAGSAGAGINLIATKDLDPFAFHANLRYTRNENSLGQNADIWRVSFAAECRVLERVRLVGDTGANRSFGRETNMPEIFVLGGVIFSAARDLDLDVGVKSLFTDGADGFAILTGATFRF